MRGGLANLGSDLRAGLGTIGAAAAVEIAGVSSEVRGVKRDLASVRASVEECRAENMEFFASFTASLEATQQGIEIMRSAPLEEAEMSLKNFAASSGNVRFLEKAHSKAMTALVQGHSLDVKLSAAIIAVSAGYVYMSKIDSPSEAKHFTVNGTLSNIIKHFAPIWADPSATATADGKKVLSFLLNLVACVCVLPSESTPVLPMLDKRLLPAFGALCAADPELRGIYPAVAGVAVRAMVEAKTMKYLSQLADEVGADVDNCVSKDAVVQALVASGKSLVPISAMKGRGLPQLQGAPASVGDAATDCAALMGFFNATNGPSWTSNAGWGTSAPLREWHGVTVNRGGRVSGLDLGENNLNGPIPTELGALTALETLCLNNNELSGSISTALGGLTALRTLRLTYNKLSGPIPTFLGGMTTLTELRLGGNKLSGPIPKVLGGLTALQTLTLGINQLRGPIPTSLGRLMALKMLLLNNNQLSGSIPMALGGLAALQTLHVSDNQLSGPIPPALVGLTSLRILALDSNHLTGPIPVEVGRLTALQTLALENNQLSGPIPSALGGLKSLTWLALHINKLTGSIPSALGALTAVENLLLHNNRLSGPIPTALGGLTALQKLRLDNNQLSGPLPSALSELTALRELWLNNNQLSGSKADVQRMLPNCKNIGF